MLPRALLSISFFISIFFFPWWVSFALATVLLLLKPTYEVLVGALLIDLLYGNFETLSDVVISFTVGAALLFLLIHYLRDKLIFYENR